MSKNNSNTSKIMVKYNKWKLNKQIKKFDDYNNVLLNQFFETCNKISY